MFENAPAFIIAEAVAVAVVAIAFAFATDALASYPGEAKPKINLELKVCGKSSIRKTLIILGSSTSVATYCTKRVPAICSLIPVNNDKIVYHRDAVQQEPFNSASTGGCKSVNGMQ
ncbi:hypothetical protein GUJ93_ZPchr0009g192 [Zizania palustris]|uniref:Uncharacterized protein n=1 Tax=Zizania palustris TaxID=103762 RepID=A0A8J5VNF1_ZIZPA|nr:hypothetical protein GUJ93_ZPchr0009g192 [Zizania palustris]